MQCSAVSNFRGVDPLPLLGSCLQTPLLAVGDL